MLGNSPSTTPVEAGRARARGAVGNWLARGPRGKWALCLLVTFLMGLVAIYYWLGLTSLAGYNGDDVIYLVLGKSLAAGSGYRVIAEPGAPFEVAYPPLYPGLLALVWRLAPQWPANLYGFKALNILAILACGLLVYRLVTRVLGGSKLTGWLSAYLTVLSPALQALVDLTMSEVVFTALVLLALGVVEPVFERVKASGMGPKAAWQLVGAGLAVAVVMLTKSLGVALVASAVAWLLWQRQWLALLPFGLGVVLGSLPWQGWVWWIRHSGQLTTWDYLGWAQGTVKPTGAFLREQLAMNLPTLFVDGFPMQFAGLLGSQRLMTAVAHVGLGGALQILAMSLVGVAVLGWAVTARARLRVWHVYMAVFLALVIGFPWNPLRYTCTLAPLLAYAYLEGCWALGRWLGGARVLARVVVAGLVALDLVSASMRVVSLARQPHFHDALLPPQDAGLLRDRLALADWVRTSAPPDARLVWDRPDLVYLDTGHLSYCYSHGLHPDRADLARFAAQPTYLVLWHQPWEVDTTHQALRRLLGPARPAFQTPGATLEVYALPWR